MNTDPLAHGATANHFGGFGPMGEGAQQCDLAGIRSLARVFPNDALRQALRRASECMAVIAKAPDADTAKRVQSYLKLSEEIAGKTIN